MFLDYDKILCEIAEYITENEVVEFIDLFIYAGKNYPDWIAVIRDETVVVLELLKSNKRKIKK